MSTLSYPCWMSRSHCCQWWWRTPECRGGRGPTAGAGGCPRSSGEPSRWWTGSPAWTHPPGRGPRSLRGAGGQWWFKLSDIYRELIVRSSQGNVGYASCQTFNVLSQFHTDDRWHSTGLHKMHRLQVKGNCTACTARALNYCTVLNF